MPGQYKMSHLLQEHAGVVSKLLCPVKNTFRAQMRLEVLLMSVQCKRSIQHDIQHWLLCRAAAGLMASALDSWHVVTSSPAKQHM